MGNWKTWVDIAILTAGAGTPILILLALFAAWPTMKSAFLKTIGHPLTAAVLSFMLIVAFNVLMYLTARKEFFNLDRVDSGFYHFWDMSVRAAATVTAGFVWAFATGRFLRGTLPRFRKSIRVVVIRKLEGSTLKALLDCEEKLRLKGWKRASDNVNFDDQLGSYSVEMMKEKDDG